MIKSILLATDGSEHAWTAWRYSLDIAHASHAWIRVLSVVDVRVVRERTAPAMGGFYMNIDPVPTEVIVAELEVRHRRFTKDFLKRTESEGLKAQATLLRGVPAEQICHHDPLVDLIAMGHRGSRSSTDRFFMGSTAESVVRTSSKPVLIAPEKYVKAERILVAYDGSAPSKRALHWAAELASTMNLSLDAVYVGDNPTYAAVTVREASEYLKPYGIRDIHTIHREGRVAKQILETARDRGAGMIVMGAHGRSRIQEALLGSITEDVLRKMDRPVLMTR
jgi:nucleotide-binding universal stress UspA family protein